MTTKIETLELFIQDGFIIDLGACTLNSRHICAEEDTTYVCFCKGTKCSECVFVTDNRETIKEVFEDETIKIL